MHEPSFGGTDGERHPSGSPAPGPSLGPTAVVAAQMAESGIGSVCRPGRRLRDDLICWRGHARRERERAGAPRQKPGTPSLLRELNDRAALELLLTEGPLTRAQLSERTGVSKVTVSQMLARLEERGLVMIAGEQAGGRGPNAALYSVVPSSAYVAGLYVEFDLVSAAVADVTGQRVADVSVDPQRRRRPGAAWSATRSGGPARAPGIDFSDAFRRRHRQPRRARPADRRAPASR